VGNKRKKKVPKRVQLRRLEKRADRALSEYVRAKTMAEYGKCPLCMEGPIECCFHFVRRRRKVLRWEIKNVVGACHRCNYVEYRDPDLSRAWYIRKHGVEQYLQLVDESKSSFQPDADYLQNIVSSYEKDLAALESKVAADTAGATGALKLAVLDLMLGPIAAMAMPHAAVTASRAVSLLLPDVVRCVLGVW